jgi:hypothetical protein
VFLVFDLAEAVIDLLMHTLLEFHYRASQAEFLIVEKFGACSQQILFFDVIHILFWKFFVMFLAVFDLKFGFKRLDIKNGLHKLLLVDGLNNKPHIIQQIIIVRLLLLHLF